MASFTSCIEIDYVPDNIVSLYLSIVFNENYSGLSSKSIHSMYSVWDVCTSRARELRSTHPIQQTMLSTVVDS